MQFISFNFELALALLAELAQNSFSPNTNSSSTYTYKYQCSNVDFFPFLGLPLIVVGIWSSLTYYLQPNRLQYSSGTNDYIDSIVDMNRSNEYDAAASTSAAESALHSELKFQTSPIH